MRDSGIDVVGDIPWGTHFCLMYSSVHELFEFVVPYLSSGLRQNEYCLWVSFDSGENSVTMEGLTRLFPDAYRYLESGQLEIVPFQQLYLRDGVFDSDRVMKGLEEKLESSLSRGYAGFRISGDASLLDERAWADFLGYERKVDGIIGRSPILALCTYCVDVCGPVEIADVISSHMFSLVKRQGLWEKLENAGRVRMEEQILEYELKYRALFGNMPMGFAFHRIIRGIDGQPVDYLFLEANESFENMTGLKREDIVGRKVTEVLPGISESGFDWIYTYGEVARTGKSVRFEQFSEILKRWYFVTAYSCKPDHFATIFLDITPQKKQLEKIAQVNEELANFSHIVTHDLKSPLLIINECLSRVIKEPGSFEKQYEIMKKQILGMSEYINRTLKLALAGKAIDSSVEIDLNELLRTVFDAYKPTDTEADLRILSVLPVMMGDPVRFEHVFMNLISNAIQHRDPGKDCLVLEVEHCFVQDAVRICLRDNGIGMDTGLVKKLFNPGFSKGNPNGSGFGLPIARKIVEAHGGRIWAESCGLGQGSSFFIEIPNSRRKEDVSR